MPKRFTFWVKIIWCFPSGSDGEESACNSGDLGSIPGLGRFPGEGNGYPLHYSKVRCKGFSRVHTVIYEDCRDVYFYCSKSYISLMHCFHFSTSLKSHLLRSMASSSHCQAAGYRDWVNCLHQDVTPQPEKDLETIPGMDVSADYCLKSL